MLPVSGSEINCLSDNNICIVNSWKSKNQNSLSQKRPMVRLLPFFAVVPKDGPPRWPSGKASASRAEGPGFESRLRRDFFGVESYQ